MSPLALGLGLLVVLAFEPVRLNAFIRFDDPQYITLNPWVKQGLTPDSVRWAFAESHASNWHPLTWLSHMLDVELFGLEPAGHHAMSALLHLGASLAFFAALRSLSGATVASALAAALFAVHPLRVESVAWAAERKDVLSMLFGMLSIWAYAGYARRGGRARYLAVFGALAFSLMSKPTFVCLPALLLLLDHWPLRRLQALASPGSTWVRLLLEKTPLVALSGVSVLVTLSVQRPAMDATVDAGVPLRIANALVSCVRYLGKTVWPSDLAVFYPHPGLPGGTPWSGPQVAGAALLLALLTLAALFLARRRPYWIVGWLWYLVSLLPVIGLVQVGNQAMADRYTYLPHAGLFLALSFGVADGARSFSRRWPGARVAAAAGSIAVLLSLVAATRVELGYWRSGLRLWERASAVTPPNPTTHDSLGGVYLDAGRLDEAIEQYRAAIALAPENAPAHQNLATALHADGRTDEAFRSFERALAIEPDYALARTNLATALLELGRIDEAIAQLRIAVEGGSARAHNQLGLALLRRGDVEHAIAQFRLAVRADPTEAEARFNLAGLLRTPDRVDEAIVHYREALRLQPDNARAHYDLATTLQLRGELDAAITHYRESLRVEPDFAPAHNNLGSALVAQGHVDAAVRHFREALRIDPDHAKARSNLERALAQ